MNICKINWACCLTFIFIILVLHVPGLQSNLWQLQGRALRHSVNTRSMERDRNRNDPQMEFSPLLRCCRRETYRNQEAEQQQQHLLQLQRLFLHHPFRRCRRTLQIYLVQYRSIGLGLGWRCVQIFWTASSIGEQCTEATWSWAPPWRWQTHAILHDRRRCLPVEVMDDEALQPQGTIRHRTCVQLQAVTCKESCGECLRYSGALMAVFAQLSPTAAKKCCRSCRSMCDVTQLTPKSESTSPGEWGGPGRWRW